MVNSRRQFRVGIIGVLAVAALAAGALFLVDRGGTVADELAESEAAENGGVADDAAIAKATGTSAEDLSVELSAYLSESPRDANRVQQNDFAIGDPIQLMFTRPESVAGNTAWTYTLSTIGADGGIDSTVAEIAVIVAPTNTARFINIAPDTPVGSYIAQLIDGEDVQAATIFRITN